MANILYMIKLTNKSQLEIINFCQDHGLIGKLCKCPICNEDMKLVPANKSDGFQWQCLVTSNRSPPHHIRRSIRNGTWFSKSKLKIGDILMITYFWVSEYPQFIVNKELDVNPNTIVEWYNFCREVCMQVLLRSKHKIGGPGNNVEISECKFEKQKFNHGKALEAQLVLVGQCLESKQCFVVHLQEDRTSETLLDIIKRKINPGTVIYSDCWTAYKCFQNKGFDQLTVTDSIIFRDPESGCQINMIEGLWRQFKPTVDRRRQKVVFNSYLAEYIYRRQMPALENKLFTFFKDIATIYATYKGDINSEKNILPENPQETTKEVEVNCQDDSLKDEVKEEVKDEIFEEFYTEERELQETNSVYFSSEETIFKESKCSITEKMDEIKMKNQVCKFSGLRSDKEEIKSEEVLGLYIVQGIKIEDTE